jgi:uncharacterized protein (DUF362 family)/Pyruvate/2-oxoacid:ferredoxin oxidoreductase delta subunit
VEIVSIINAKSYEQDELHQAMLNLLHPLGGISAFIAVGDRVLIKPNMLAAKTPEQAVTTHPALVRVVAQLVRDAGGIVFIGDSPGIGGFQRVAQKSGISDAAKESGATLVDFTEPVEVPGTGTFRTLHLAKTYYEADKIINLPKLKTHEMMTMTCAVKNLFGAVIGAEKAAWHLKAGNSRAQFAKLLLEIYLAKKPVLNIVDAITAMEGNGPGSGTPLQRHILLAGANAVAVDVVAGKLAGIPEDLLHVELMAKELNLPGATMADIQLCGTTLESVRGERFKLPDGLDVRFGLPTFVANLLKSQLTAYPKADTSRCILCGVCRDACPPGAITIKNSALSVDNARCIRCWCCRELCPHDAMLTCKSLMLQILQRLAAFKGA